MNLKEQYNLPAYLMLPLIKLDINSFGENNLINVYALESMGVVVKVKNKQDIPFEYYNNVNYEVDYDEEDHTIIVFNVPNMFEQDFKYMLEGKYSKIQMLTKDIIKSKSTLAYKKPIKATGKTVWDSKTKRMVPEFQTSTHIILKALDLDNDNLLYNKEEDKPYSLRHMLEQEIGVKLPKNSELLSKLNDNEIFNK